MKYSEFQFNRPPIPIDYINDRINFYNDIVVECHYCHKLTSEPTITHSQYDVKCKKCLIKMNTKEKKFFKKSCCNII